MAGHVFRRCTTCGGRVDDDHGDVCAGRRSTWAFRVDVAPESSGRRVQRRGGGYPSRRAAERAMREILTKLDNATYVPVSEQTLGGFLLDDWLPAQLPPKTSANRYRNKRNAIRRVLPELGDVRLQQVTPADLERCYATLLHGSQHANGRPARTFAPATVLQTHGVIRQALQDAVKWGLLERNVADQADPPSNAAVSADRRRAMQVWSPEQLADFLQASREHWLFPMWLLAATTGLRRGELVGIVDDGLDLATGVLVVSWQLVPEEDPARQGHTRPVHKQVTKTAASSRTINLDGHTAAEIVKWTRWRDAQFEDLRVDVDGMTRPACDAGHPSTRHGRFTFTWPDGRHLNPDWVSHEFKRLREDAGVPPIRLHDLRHTHASLLLASGEHLKVVQERLGWTTASFMLDTYAHLLPGMQAEAAERFADRIFPERGR